MRLAEVEVVPYALPFERAYTTARGSLERREMLLLRLITDEGLVGLGEAVPLALRGGADLAADRAGAAQGHPAAAPGRPLGFRRRRADARGRRRLSSTRRGPAPARPREGRDRDGDLRSRRQGLGAAAVVAAGRRGGQRRCSATRRWSAASPHAVAADAERWAARGFETFKLKLGAGDDVAQVRAVRERLGPDARIRVDANGAWSVDEALGVLRLIEPLGIELVEQPVADNAARWRR